MRECVATRRSTQGADERKKVCPGKDEPPPGDLIYEKDGYAIHQVDGEETKVASQPKSNPIISKLPLNPPVKLYAQNLSLFAKLFLDTKSVFFDVSSFLYYLLIQKCPPSNLSKHGGQVVGFFSKEKMSWDNNNLACILIFPPWQRLGLGQILMAASYVLGRHENRFGGPEKPLSVQGRKAYLTYWCGEVARAVLQAPGKETMSVRVLSERTWILTEDVVAALREMGVCEGRKTASGSLVVNKSKARAWAERRGASLAPVVDAEAFLLDEAEKSGDDAGSESEEGG